MPKLNEIIIPAEVVEITGDEDKEVSSLVSDSRKAEKGCLFFAVKGMAYDGHDYINEATEKGAVAVVCEKLPQQRPGNITYIRVGDTAREMGKIASAFYGYPSKQLKVVGVTGTNGKTTTVVLLHRLFRQLGYKAGLISTVNYFINDSSIPAFYTTPDSLMLQRLLGEMVSRGCEYCFMEVSSHSIAQKRISGLFFTGAVFTNITHDHIDYHSDFASYLRSKKEFFDNLPQNAFALVNADDKNASVIVQNTVAQQKTFAVRSMADYKARIVESRFDGTLINIEGTELWTHLIGEFNAYNLLGIYAVSDLLGADRERVLQIASSFNMVPGRFEYIRSDNNVTAIVDYAHTPDALENVLKTVDKLKNKQQRVITVVGSGGDRDKAKRPVMAGIAISFSDIVILTSDNPRNEDPEVIIRDMMEGVEKDQMSKVLSITGRAEAIKTGCMMASPGDIVLVAGKGHETYQEVKGERYHFDDREVIESIFKTTAKK